MGSRRSSYNDCLELGIYVNMIVRWFIHASVVSYVQNNNALGSIKTIEQVALRSLRLGAAPGVLSAPRRCTTLKCRRIVKNVNS